MTKGRLVLALLGTLGLVACTTKVGEMMTAMTEKDPDVTAHVAVYREASLQGGVAAMPLFIDGKEVHALTRGERYSFQLDPGRHDLGYWIGLTECERSFQFSAPGQYDFRLLPTCGFERTNPQQQ